MDSKEIKEKERIRRESVLAHHGVRPTAMRTLVYSAIEDMGCAFGVHDIEQALDTADRSTIFRTISLFVDHHLLHHVEDGSGEKKYCLCRHEEENCVSEMHCHFYCERCGVTRCLEDVHVPQVSLPKGYRVYDVEYLLRGICPRCATQED